VTEWPRVQLRQFCRFSSGGKLRITKSDYVAKGFPAFSAKGQDGFVARAEFDQPGIVVSSIGARCGKAFLATGKWTSLANTYCVLPDTSRVNVEFLWYLLNDEGSWVRSGTAQPFIKPSDIQNRLVPVPPLDEQRRMVDILNRANGIRRLRREAMTKARQLVRAMFVEMFGDPATNPRGWPTATLGDLISDGPQNGLYRPASDYGEGTPIVRIDSFYDGVITRVEQLRRVRLDQTIIERYRLREHDILVNRVNSRPFLGKSAIVPALREPTVFESNMMRLAIRSEIVAPRYLIEALQHRHVRDQLLARAKDAINQSSINQQDIRSLGLYLPPIDLQLRFIDRLSDLTAVITQQERMAAAADQLVTSLAARFFTTDA
jgi:type I restriction enzyme S subunit